MILAGYHPYMLWSHKSVGKRALIDLYCGIANSLKLYKKGHLSR